MQPSTYHPVITLRRVGMDAWSYRWEEPGRHTEGRFNARSTMAAWWKLRRILARPTRQIWLTPATADQPLRLTPGPNPLRPAAWTTNPNPPGEITVATNGDEFHESSAHAPSESKIPAHLLERAKAARARAAAVPGVVLDPR